MLRHKIGLLIISIQVVLFLVSCSRAPSGEQGTAKLQGRWELVLGHDCSDYGIGSDVLILHSDGTFEQHFRSVSGQHYDTTNQRWSYSLDKSISFDSRKNFFTKQPPDSVVGTAIHETLIVEFGNPNVIVLNPDSDCFYRQTGG